MNKEEVAAAVAKELGLTDAEKLVGSVFSIIQQELASGGSVTVKGFGKFWVAKRDLRRGRNPQTGEEIPIASKLAPEFKAGKALKSAVAEAPVADPGA